MRGEAASWAGAIELPTDFRHPVVHTNATLLVRHFESEVAAARAPLRNPHHEPMVSEEEWERARPSAVLVPIVVRDQELSVLLTRRHRNISYAGHICFPGGRADPSDATVEATALRETHEEIGLDPARVQVIGRLGDYVTHSGYRIAPVVGLVTPPLELVPNPGEVEEILELPLDHVLRSDSYRLARRGPESSSAVFFLQYEEAVVTGPTVALLMGLYEELLKTHDPDRLGVPPGAPEAEPR
jgi:8-oxo-dGTP pyrophosphatase MutT (NUDIX family)